VTTCIGVGWGSGWGSPPWGGGPGSELALQGALAIRENVIRLQFDQPVMFDGTLTTFDGTSPDHYAVTEVAGDVGLDDRPIRPVVCVLAELAVFEGAGGRFVDISLDRYMSHWPCRYTVAVNNLFTITGFPLDLCFTHAQVVAVQQQYNPPALDNIVPSRDIANPQTRSATLDPLPDPMDPFLLGSVPVDSSGDYAFDEGITNLKKRIYRRLVTRKGAYLAIPTYGVGIPSYGKRLLNGSIRESIRADAEAQIGQEPDVLAVSVTSTVDPNIPGKVTFGIRVRSLGGKQANLQIPFLITV